MAITKKIKQLVNPANSEEYIYPITGTAATYDANGNSVDDLLLAKLSIDAANTLLANKADKTTSIIAGTGLITGGTLSGQTVTVGSISEWYLE